MHGADESVGDFFAGHPREYWKKRSQFRLGFLKECRADDIVALGVIPWIFSGDALTVDRGTSSVISYKVEKIVEGGDIPGFQYHFWGYLTQGIIGNKTRVKALAYLYEKVYQKDIPDWTIDDLSLRFADKVRVAFKNPKICQSLHSH